MFWDILARLETGSVVFDGKQIAIRGTIESGFDAAQFKALIDGKDWTHLPIGTIDIKPSSEQAATWVASKNGDVIKINGPVPSPETKHAIADMAKKTFPMPRFVDNTVVCRYRVAVMISRRRPRSA